MMDNRNKTWNEYMKYFSAPYTQKYLFHCYERKKLEKAEQKSYENCYPFIYYLEHAKNYYELSTHSPLSIKPVLLFYGMTQLFKACLLTVDASYPHNTSVLAHGVTTRKRKKQSYDFLDDEVKVQKNGLFSHISAKMFHMEHLEGNKYSMSSLMSQVVEMTPLHQEATKPLKINTNWGRREIEFPTFFLDLFHMNTERFHSYIKGKATFGIQANEEKKKSISFRVLEKSINLSSCSPFMYHLDEDALYFPNTREGTIFFPEPLSHYLVLYNLSMISRYETEWWYELLHTYSSHDYPFITHFLSITEEKIPFLLLSYLKHNEKGLVN